MKEVNGDIWELHAADPNSWVVVTTNGVLKTTSYTNGVQDVKAVMGKGIALEAAKKHPVLPYKLAAALVKAGNHVFTFPEYRLFTFPTKEHWSKPSPEYLIERSATELTTAVDNHWPESDDRPTIYLPRPGCGNGGLLWKDVKPLISPLLSSDSFVVVSR